MKKIYLVPVSEVYALKTSGNVMLGASEKEAIEQGESGGDGFSKETDWEDEDDDY